MQTQALFDSFCEIMDRLLGENGCPWDRAQTHESLRPYLLEETYEAADAIDQGDMTALCEELGDVLMEVVFHAKLAERSSAFTMDDVLTGISQKLVSRHSHIFGTDKAANADEVKDFWEKNKNAEKNNPSVADTLRAVPKAMPAMMRAEKVLKRAKISVNTADCFRRAHSLLNEMESALSENINAGTGEKPTFQTAEKAVGSLEENFGELLFTMANLSVQNEINAEFSLTNAVEAFINSY